MNAIGGEKECRTLIRDNHVLYVQRNENRVRRCKAGPIGAKMWEQESSFCQAIETHVFKIPC